MKKMKYYLILMIRWLNDQIFFSYGDEPGLSQNAVMNGFNFVRGRLGNTGFRRQYVSDGRGGYTRKTVAFTMPETNSSNTTLQQNQRSKFRTLAVLGGLLNRCGILRKFYYSGLGISSYNAFVRDNLQREASVKCDDGNTYIDWPKLLIAIGNLARKIVPYQSSLVPGTDYDDECKHAIHLRWSNQGIKSGIKGDWALILVGIKINEDGTAEDVIIHQPGATLSQCSADVILEKCNCCKTYWFALFSNTYTGENSNSVYLGADASTFENLPVYDPATCCFNCEEEDVTEEICILPSDEPEFCGCGHEEADVVAEDIVFTGKLNIDGFGINEIELLDAGNGDGSGFDEDNDDTTIVTMAIDGLACPIVFSEVSFDLSSIGGNTAETFTAGSDLAVRVTDLLNDGTWAYDDASCTLQSSDTSLSDGSITGTEIVQNNLVMMAINGTACPIDFENTNFDMSPFGGTNDEEFSDGDELAARINALLNDGTWSYNATSCQLESTDTSSIGGTIEATLAAGVSDFSVESRQTTTPSGETAEFLVRVNDISGGENRIVVLIETDQTGFTYPLGNFTTSTADLAILQPGITINITDVGNNAYEVEAVGPLAVGDVWTIQSNAIQNPSGVVKATLLEPVPDGDSSNNVEGVAF